LGVNYLSSDLKWRIIKFQR